MNQLIPSRNIDRIAGLLVLMAFGSLTVMSQTSYTVEVTSNVFTPDELTIDPGDTVIWVNSQGSHNVNGTQETFPSNPESFGNAVGSEWTYSHVFTIPGTYDYRCDPHYVLGMVGKIEVTGNSSSAVTVNLDEMGPHVGQQIYFALVNATTGEVIDRTSQTGEESFSVVLNGVESGSSYHVDFFADQNGNGYYDAPPTDHAWRLEIPSATGGEVLSFTHTGNFTDVMWKHRLRVHFSGMTPHVGQMLTLYIQDLASGEYLDTVIVPSIENENFVVESYQIEPTGSYRIDFYADLNGNGSYDAPPADHAWRLDTGPTMGDVDLDFTHNTDFTDIFATTSLKERQNAPRLSIYPNPAASYVSVEADREIESVFLYNSNGSRISVVEGLHSRWIRVSLEAVPSGVYFLEVVTTDRLTKTIRFVKQ